MSAHVIHAEEQQFKRKLTLPLLHHALEFVVQDDDLHADVELRGRRELHRCHAERRVAVDVDDGLVWRTDFCADGSWETEAHRLRIQDEYRKTREN